MLSRAQDPSFSARLPRAAATYQAVDVMMYWTVPSPGSRCDDVLITVPQSKLSVLLSYYDVSEYVAVCEK